MEIHSIHILYSQIYKDTHAWAAGELCCSRSVLAISVYAPSFLSLSISIFLPPLSFACLSPVMASRLPCNVQPRGLWHFIKLRASYYLPLSLSLSHSLTQCVSGFMSPVSTSLACLLL